MAQVTPYMGLTAWDLESDPYDHNQLVNNWNAVDAHNHTPGKGAPLPPEAIPIIEQGGLGVCSVTTVNICNGAVTNPKLATDSVATVNIRNGAVTRDKIANGAINQTKLAAASVGEGELINGSVTSPKIQDNAVINQKIRDSAVTSAKIGIGQVGPWQLASNSVDTRVLTPDAVITENIADGAVTNSQIGNLQVTPNKFFPGPAAAVAKTNKQLVSHGGWQDVQWNTVRYSNSWFPMWEYPGFRVHIAGMYVVSANVMWDDGNADDQAGIRRIRIRKNGTIHGGAGPDKIFPDADGGVYRCRQTVSLVVNCLPGDFIDVNVFQDSGRNQWVGPDGLSTNFGITWITAIF